MSRRITKDSATTRLYFSPIGTRRVLAEERRLRRHAEQLGLRASKSKARHVGGWRLLDEDGLPIAANLDAGRAMEFVDALRADLRVGGAS